MSDSSISYSYEKKQLSMIESLNESSSADMVFCPMCEDMHENNSMCQMSWSD